MLTNVRVDVKNFIVSATWALALPAVVVLLACVSASDWDARYAKFAGCTNVLQCDNR